jgi:hypothetical protein
MEVMTIVLVVIQIATVGIYIVLFIRGRKEIKVHQDMAEEYRKRCHEADMTITQMSITMSQKDAEIFNLNGIIRDYRNPPPPPSPVDLLKLKHEGYA